MFHPSLLSAAPALWFRAGKHQTAAMTNGKCRFLGLCCGCIDLFHSHADAQSNGQIGKHLVDAFPLLTSPRLVPTRVGQQMCGFIIEKEWTHGS
jgi:hypothetical protein